MSSLSLERTQEISPCPWLHFNRYNCSFNPEGIDGLPIPDMGINFGMILAYSVFTHTTRDEMKELVEQLQARLAPGGTLAFTFIDPHFNAWPETYKGNNLNAFGTGA